ncbi:hypothetical protein ILUMI_08251 [Ignelater luminosus]|uniref:Luciferin 4-monooxygenase n=1 Tax=Ignelater luminosus TaxID=2038154 RepID=A0A8K0D2A6_IGNLU|nr:hypothetical protein ILUMI_08251 [Ignelater luminosus]
MQQKIISDGNIIRVSPDKELPYSKGIGEIIFEKLRTNKHLPMQIDGLTGEVDTYDSVLQRSIRTAITMRSKGITREDIITVCSYNHLNTNIPIIASLFLGVKTASIDPNLALSDAKHLLNLVKPKMIFVSQDGIKLIEDTIREIGINPELVVFGETTKHTEFSEFLNEAPEQEQEFIPVEIKNLKETFSIFFSSGTSGLAKGVCLSHLSLIPQFPPKEMGNSLGTVSLTYSSPYWISSIVMLAITILTSTCRLVLPKFEIEDFWYLLDKYKVSAMLLSPTQLATVCNNKKPENIDTSNLKLLYAGGSTIYKEQLDRMKQFLPTTIVATGYGQTELGGGCLSFGLSEIDIKSLNQKPTSCGKPLSGFIYKIVDLETEEPLGPNQKGELRIKTEFCMNGYHNIDSSNSWDPDGFLKTGDIAYYDEEYCFYIVDRIKDMLKFQGWQIAPAKLESILLSHPAIETALVIGLPHPVDCDHPTGIIRLNSFARNVSVEDIQKYYNEKIDDDRHRLRGGLKVVDSIPLTPSGKYKKRHFKDLILSGNL